MIYIKHFYIITIISCVVQLYKLFTYLLTIRGLKKTYYFYVTLWLSIHLADYNKPRT